MVEVGGPEHPGVLETRDLLILLRAQDAQYDKIAATSGETSSKSPSELVSVLPLRCCQCFCCVLFSSVRSPSEPG